MKSHYAIGIILLFCVNFCNAYLYKWTDKNGTTHFSDQSNGEVNTEKLENHSDDIISHTKKDSKTSVIDSDLMEYMDQLVEISKEISNDADSCYNFAINRNEIDISCKNYNTVLNRDFKPLAQKIKQYIIEHPISEDSRKELELRFNKLEGIAE